MEEREYNLWRLLEIIGVRLKFIIIFTFAVTIVAVVVSLLLPKWYAASVLLLPPKEESYDIGWSSRMSDIISLTAGIKLPVMATPSDVYARILESRAMATRVVDANNLAEYYRISSMPDLYKKLEKRAKFQVTPEGLLEVTYIDKSPEMAAKIANSYAEELNKMTLELSNSRARGTREFIEKRLAEVSADLDSARRAFREFERTNKAIDLDGQTQLAIQGAVDLKIALAQNEIELSIKEKSLSATHPDVISLKRRVAEIKKQISAIEFGGPDSSYFNLPISEIPDLRVTYAELNGRLQVSEALYKILSEQYEQAKIQEKMNAPMISILDPAFPPDLAIKPQKRIIVAAAFIISFLAAVFLALFSNYLEELKVRSPRDYERVKFFYGTILSWIPGIKRLMKGVG
jgi:tyrosine-protein kinase Etk/Wzc